MSKTIKTITLPRNLFIANQVILVAECFSLAFMVRHQARKRFVAENEYYRLLAETIRIMDYADKSLMPQQLIDDITFRTMAALADETSDVMDTPEDER